MPLEDRQLPENTDWTFDDLNKLKIKVRKNEVTFRVAYDPKFNSFWAEGFEKDWEPITFEVYDKFIDPEKIYIDFGAWIGPTLLYAAAKAKHVYGVEPDRVAFQVLGRNVSANPELASKITICEQAISAVNGQLTLFYSGPGGDSCSSVVTGGNSSYTVKGVAIADFFSENRIDPSEVGFIKIDIEGAEFDLIDSLGSFLKENNIRPTLYISTHRPYIKKMLKRRYRWLGPFKSPLARAATRKKVRSFVEKLDALDYKCKYDSRGQAIDDLYRWASPKGYQTILLTDQPWLHDR